MSIDIKLQRLAEEHRQSLIQLHRMLGNYLRKRIATLQSNLKTATKNKRKSDVTKLSPQLDTLRAVQDELTRLRIETNCISAGHRVTAWLQLSGNSTSDPTPEEIEAACKRLQDEWSEAERHWRAGLNYSDTVEFDSNLYPDRVF